MFEKRHHFTLALVLLGLFLFVGCNSQGDVVDDLETLSSEEFTYVMSGGFSDVGSVDVLTEVTGYAFGDWFKKKKRSRKASSRKASNAMRKVEGTVWLSCEAKDDGVKVTYTQNGKEKSKRLRNKCSKRKEAFRSYSCNGNAYAKNDIPCQYGCTRSGCTAAPEGTYNKYGQQDPSKAAQIKDLARMKQIEERKGLEEGGLGGIQGIKGTGRQAPGTSLLPGQNPHLRGKAPARKTSPAGSMQGKDTDGDSIPDHLEKGLGLDPTKKDSDWDGILDGDEDFDGDLVFNALEINVYGSDPTKKDTDGDGLGDLAETIYGTSLTNPDTDGDDINDDIEVKIKSNPRDFNSGPSSTLDSDGDGLTDLEEYRLGTDPTKKDTDGDGINDLIEVTEFTTDPTKKDTDDDGLTDAEEALVHGTNPSSRDTDSDGFPDGLEVKRNRDPKDPDDKPDKIAYREESEAEEKDEKEATNNENDDDGDGYTNDEEKEAGSDPDDAESTPEESEEDEKEEHSSCITPEDCNCEGGKMPVQNLDGGYECEGSAVAKELKGRLEKDKPFTGGTYGRVMPKQDLDRGTATGGNAALRQCSLKQCGKGMYPVFSDGAGCSCKSYAREMTGTSGGEVIFCPDGLPDCSRGICVCR
jgi:hypothetical protein